MAVSNVQDNPQQPGIQSEAYLPDQLVADAKTLVTQPIVVLTGTLKRGTVLGQQTSSPINAAAKAGNTGNATIGTLSVGAAPKVGLYKAIATDATHFAVTDPEGNAVGNATAGAAFSTGGQIGFTITAGGTPCVAGDEFDITVSDATGGFIACVKTASDGSQNPAAILVDDADASAGPVTSGGYVMGEFNGNALTFDASWTLAQLVSAARAVGIFIKSSVPAASPANNTAP